jgi:DNA-binding MarR family transcriptional regulator
MLVRLDEAGLIERTADPADRRSSLLTVSDAGRDLLALARTRKDAYLARRLESLDADDRAVLDRAAAILERMLQEGDE